MGEFLRSAYPKQLVNLSQVHLRTKTLQMHQWGVNLPGACEALCHWRGTIEPLVLNGTIEPLVAADLDLVNMFGNAEWPHIRAALRTHFPEASSWTEWQHQSNSVTTLPSGCEFSTDRGAEQGDVLGTIQSALVLGDARTCRISSPLLVSKRASVMSGSSMTGSALFGPCSLIGGCARWTLLWHPLAPPGVALSWAMPRALLASSAHPSASMSSAAGTLLTSVTQ